MKKERARGERRIKRLASIAILFGFVCFACGPDGGPPADEPGSDGPSSAAENRPLPPALGDPVVDSRLRVIHTAGSDWVVGDTLDLSDLEGKPTVLDFWASWCGPCLIQHEYVLGLKAEYGDQINVVGVLWEDEEENAAPWLEEHGAAYPTVIEMDGNVEDQFWISGLPHFIMLTPDRRLSWDMAFPWAKDSVAVRLQDMLSG